MLDQVSAALGTATDEEANRLDRLPAEAMDTADAKHSEIASQTD